MGIITVAIPLILSVTIACATATKNWADLPSFKVNECAMADRVVSKNAQDLNSYISVIGYHTASDSPKKRAQEIISVYLIVIFHLINDKQGIVDAQSILITTRSKDSPLVRNWVISDTDADGFVDKARYLEINEETTQTAANESDAPSEIVSNLQPYFEKTRELMYSIGVPDKEKCAASLYTRRNTLIR